MMSQQDNVQAKRSSLSASEVSEPISTSKDSCKDDGLWSSVTAIFGDSQALNVADLKVKMNEPHVKDGAESEAKMTSEIVSSVEADPAGTDPEDPIIVGPNGPHEAPTSDKTKNHLDEDASLVSEEGCGKRDNQGKRSHLMEGEPDRQASFPSPNNEEIPQQDDDIPISNTEETYQQDEHIADQIDGEYAREESDKPTRKKLTREEREAKRIRVKDTMGKLESLLGHAADISKTRAHCRVHRNMDLMMFEIFNAIMLLYCFVLVFLGSKTSSTTVRMGSSPQVYLDKDWYHQSFSTPPTYLEDFFGDLWNGS